MTFLQDLQHTYGAQQIIITYIKFLHIFMSYKVSPDQHDQ